MAQTLRSGRNEGLLVRPRPGGPSKVTPEFVKELLAVVRKRPRGLSLPFSLWSCQRLAHYLTKQPELRVSHETIRRQLADGGIALSRPQHKISSPNPDYEVKKAIEETRSGLASGDVFYYADEFNVSWLSTLRAMWSPLGRQVMVPTPHQPYKRYGLGAVDYHSGETVVLFRRRKRRLEVAEFYRRF